MQLWRLKSPHDVLSASRKDGGVIQSKSRVLRTRGTEGRRMLMSQLKQSGRKGQVPPSSFVICSGPQRIG